VYSGKNFLTFFRTFSVHLPIPVAARSKSKVCVRSLTGISDSNAACSKRVPLASVVCYQVEIFCQKSPTEFSASECDCGASKMRKFCPTKGCCTNGKKN
jgi:hypothetical protein